jgi:hypothetical protein
MTAFAPVLKENDGRPAQLPRVVIALIDARLAPQIARPARFA